MASRTVLILNQTVPQIQEIQAGDTYNMPADVSVTGNITVSGTVDGRDVAADGALLDTATQPGDNISTLVNDIIALQAEAEAGTNNTKMMTPLRVAQAISVLASGLQNKLDATAAPLTTNDDSEGYAVGSFWVDVTNDEAYRCVDATTNLAVWVKTTLQTTDLASVALSGSDSDDLPEGATNLFLTSAERSKVGYLTVTQAVDLDALETDVASHDTELTYHTSVTTGIAAYAGGGQANATQLTSKYNVVSTVATIADSVKLPAAEAGKRVVVFNRAANSLDLFPATGDNIEGNGVDAAQAVAGGSKIDLVAVDTTNWYAE